VTEASGIDHAVPMTVPTTEDSGTENGVRRGIMDPAPRGDERTALVGFLQRQRELVAWKLAGAGDDVLRAVATPTGMTPAGLIQHLTHVERFWIRDTFAGQKDLPYAWTDEDPDGEWKVPADVPMAQVLAEYAAETALSDAVIATASMDDVSVHRNLNLRWILLHLIEETARHLGHIDLLRENADDVVGEEPEASPAD
jgi:uncharacterized damage-inducible protein DinB